MGKINSPRAIVQNRLSLTFCDLVSTNYSCATTKWLCTLLKIS